MYVQRRAELSGGSRIYMPALTTFQNCSGVATANYKSIN